MTPAKPSQRFASLPTQFCVAVVVLAATLSALGSNKASSVALLVALTATYGALATFGLVLVERVDSPRARAAFLVGLGALALGIIHVSDGYATLVVMPLISYCVLYVSTTAGVLASFAVCASLALVTSLRLFTIEFAQTSGSLLSGCAFVVVFSRLWRRERESRDKVERLAAELESANERLREYAARAEELAASEERNRIAREIHDGLGHYLTTLHVQVEAARATLGADDTAARACLDRARTLAKGGLDEVRRSVAVLRAPDAIHRRLPDALAALVAQSRAAGLAVDLDVVGEARDLSPDVGYAVYRAAQEALTNARKHASARRVAVALAFGRGEVRLRVDDDGVGAESVGGGFGLLGLRERIELAGGAVKVETARGKGFKVELMVPA